MGQYFVESPEISNATNYSIFGDNVCVFCFCIIPVREEKHLVILKLNNVVNKQEGHQLQKGLISEHSANVFARLKAIETLKVVKYWPENGKFKVEYEEE